MNPGSYEHEKCSKWQLIPYIVSAYQYLKIEVWTNKALFLKSTHICINSNGGVRYKWTPEVMSRTKRHRLHSSPYTKVVHYMTKLIGCQGTEIMTTNISENLLLWTTNFNKESVKVKVPRGTHCGRRKKIPLYMYIVPKFYKCDKKGQFMSSYLAKVLKAQKRSVAWKKLTDRLLSDFRWTPNPLGLL